jgi:ribosome-binding protein aMBF1 (putative translation factor)
MSRHRRCTSEVGLGTSARGALDDFDPALQVARAIMQARTAAGLSQAELASRMRTSQSFVAILESGRTLPSTTTLVKVARATGTLLRLELVGRSRDCGNGLRRG